MRDGHTNGTDTRRNFTTETMTELASIPVDVAAFSAGVTDEMRKLRGVYTMDASASGLSDYDFAQRYPKADLAITLAVIGTRKAAQ